MQQRISNLLIWVYGIALVLMAGVSLALLDLLPGVQDFQVSGLSNMRALGLTLALMALVGLRLFLHLRARQSAAVSPTSDTVE